VFELPVTVAENAREPKVGTVTREPLPATTTLTAEPVWRVTVAVPDFVESERAVAAMVTVAGAGTVVGATYTPSREIKPWTESPPRMPLTFQTTVWSSESETVALNAWVPPLETVAELGAIVTFEAVGGGVPPLSLDVPHDAARTANENSSDKRRAVPLMVSLFSGFHDTPGPKRTEIPGASGRRISDWVSGRRAAAG
jgi:hypothetical protein